MLFSLHLPRQLLNGSYHSSKRYIKGKLAAWITAARGLKKGGKYVISHGRVCGNLSQNVHSHLEIRRVMHIQFIPRVQSVEAQKLYTNGRVFSVPLWLT